MTIEIRYKSSVYNDLKKIKMPSAGRIMDKIEDELGENPDKGIPLKGKFKGLFKYRVGDYRVVYVKGKNHIEILRIGHRRSIYK